MISRMDLPMLLAAFATLLTAVFLWVAEQDSGALLATSAMSLLVLSVGIRIRHSMSLTEQRSIASSAISLFN